jgi:hypothetical protein
MRTNIVASRAIDAVAGAKFKKRAKLVEMKNAFDFRRIGANRGGGGDRAFVLTLPTLWHGR